MLNCIHADAQLGQNVKVGNFTTICEDVVIGDGCDIGNNVTIFPGARFRSKDIPRSGGCSSPPGLEVSRRKQHCAHRRRHNAARVRDGASRHRIQRADRGRLKLPYHGLYPYSA